jgi:hypothetical protein
MDDMACRSPPPSRTALFDQNSYLLLLDGGDVLPASEEEESGAEV